MYNSVYKCYARKEISSLAFSLVSSQEKKDKTKQKLNAYSLNWSNFIYVVMLFHFKLLMYLSSLIYHLHVRWRESEDTLPTCMKLRVSSLRIKSTFKLQVLFNILNCL